MSEQLAEEGSKLGEHHHFGPLMFVFKVRYSASDYLHALYITTVIPCFTVLSLCTLGFAFFLHLGPGMYFGPTITLLLLITSLCYLHDKRQGRPVLLPYKKSLRVYAYRAGLICMQDEHATAVPWSDITRIRYKQHKPAALTLWRCDGPRLHFDSNLQNLDILGRLVEREYRQNSQNHTATAIHKSPQQKRDTHQGA